MNITVRTDRQLARAAGESIRYVLATVTAPEAPRRAERTPVNVALVLDRSGSMGGQKIALAKVAVERALRMLHPSDRFALVVYDDEVDVLMESTPCTAGAREEALRRLAAIEARGTTDLSGGWLKGCEQVARFIESGALGRCLLLTDGLMNRGILDPEELIEHVTELRRRGVVTSTFGVGADFDEQLLQRMADAGAGHFYFIERAEQIVDLLTSELGEAFEVVARGVFVTAEAPHGTRIEPLNPFPSRQTPHGIALAPGDLVSSQEVVLVFKVIMPAGAEGRPLAVTFGVGDESGAIGRVSTTATWTFASHAANDAQSRDAEVDQAVAEIYAARARAEAVEANRRHDFGTARQVLRATAAKIDSYAGSNIALQRLAHELRASVHEHEHAMAPMALKERHFVAHAALRSRDPRGTARRSL
jgi:hypothetical protein